MPRNHEPLKAILHFRLGCTSATDDLYRAAYEFSQLLRGVPASPPPDESVQQEAPPVRRGSYADHALQFGE